MDDSNNYASKTYDKIRAFSEKWANRGYEKGDTQVFWLELLRTVFDIEDPESMILFENRVRLNEVSFIDAYIPLTSVLIEQKSSDIDLDHKIRQSDGEELTPFEQALRYSKALPWKYRPRWIVVSNFAEIRIYYMESETALPYIIKLSELPLQFPRLRFLIDPDVQPDAIMSVFMNAGPQAVNNVSVNLDNVNFVQPDVFLALHPKKKLIYIPECNAHVYLKQLSKRLVKLIKNEYKDNLEASFIISSLIDRDGNYLFKETDMDYINALPCALLDELYDEIKDYNRFS